MRRKNLTKQKSEAKIKSLKVNKGLLKKPTPEEFSKFFAEEEQNFYDFLRNLGGFEHQIGEIYSDLMAKVIKDYDPKHNCTLRTFAYNVSRQVHLNYTRFHSRKGRDKTVNSFKELDESPANETDFDRVEFYIILGEAKNDLSIREKQFLEGLISGFLPAEISRQLEISEGRGTQIMKGLREKLEPYFKEAC